ncbi:MAG: archaemetzincin [Planctomycetaceae bacterium]|nr:archaemetzincin [Planctomycetaceae bacterium]
MENAFGVTNVNTGKHWAVWFIMLTVTLGAVAVMVAVKAHRLDGTAASLPAATNARPTPSPTSRPIPQSRPSPPPTAAQLKKMIPLLEPLFEKMGKPKPGEWLDRFKEPGQTFDEYLRCNPVLPRGRRSVLYIQPLGDFTAGQRRVVELTGQFSGLYFNLPVTFSKDLPLSVIPAKAQRVHPSWGDRQVLSTYVLDPVLATRLPQDAAAYIAFTASDLWPGEGWNFVFGQASLSQRVGVWSIYRNGDADKDQSFRLCLLRTMKTAVHESGHMFSILHCTAYYCCMSGCNNQQESDAHPLALCPQCLAKVCWATQTWPGPRYKALADFCRANGLKEQADFYDKCRLAVAK